MLIAHEFAHLAGALHKAFTAEGAFEEPVTLMDKAIQVPLGPDLTFGTADDVPMYFRPDGYSTDDGFVGLNDTLNTIAFGLSTGKAARRCGGLLPPPRPAWAPPPLSALWNASAASRRSTSSRAGVYPISPGGV